MARYDVSSSPATRTPPSEAHLAPPSRRVTLPLEPLDVPPVHKGVAGSIDDLIAALGPANLKLVSATPHVRPLAEAPMDLVAGEVITLYYGTGVNRAADLADGNTAEVGIGRHGYYGAGVYLTGDTYTALRVSESAIEREGLYGADAVHQVPVPINLFTMQASVGRVCELKACAGELRHWAWQQFGQYEAEAVLRLIPDFLKAHGYDSAVIRSEAGPDQDYWLIPERYRLTMVDHAVLLPTRNLIGQRGQAPGSPVRLETIVANVPLDPAVFASESLTGSQLDLLQQWREARAAVSAKDAFQLEAQQRLEVRHWLKGRLPVTAPEFSRRCLMVDGLAIEPAQRIGMPPERWQQLFVRLVDAGDWETEILSRVVELILLKPEKYPSITTALYWAVRQYVRRSGW